MSLFADFEKGIERGFRKWTERVLGPAEANELMMVHRAILEQVGGHVETLARGKRVFPYGRVIVTLCPSEVERRARWLAALGEGRLEGDIREALQTIGCEMPGVLAVEVRTGEPAAPGTEDPFVIEYQTLAAAPAAPVAVAKPGAFPEAPAVAAATGAARLVVVKGKAQREEYTLDGSRINIGRMAELTDAEQRVVLRNHVVFEEGEDEANGTVSRRHAHIRRDAGDYRLCDDESEFGTRVFRNGRPIEVPAGNRRGEKLRPGDEIYLGRACLRFEQ